ncbi:MAG: TrkH family potassium uptake protein [Eubacteriales bacterium]|nr:TrkH family potassium uptake protein [Eubacteriales bacterium]
MNYSIIFYIIGWILKVEAALMLLPCGVAVIYGERDGIGLAATAAVCLILGILMTWKKSENQIFYAAEGLVTVALSWLVLSVAGAVPFVISGYITNPVDALFEAVSGFTTTGASILTDVEALPYCLLFWRSFTHWIGGMGVLVFLLIVLPMTGGSHMNLMKAESPGPIVSRLVPKVQSTAKILYGIYIVLTIVELVFLLAGRMPLFDALATSFGTAGTGGFGIKNDSMAGYSPYIQNVVTVFMILFGINFNAYFLILMGKVGQALKMEEVRAYLLVIAAAIALISWNSLELFSSLGESVHHAAFQVGSIITTTGFATTNFDLWPQLSRSVLVVLMFIGACAGSTGGGIKVSRLIILAKTVRKELIQMVHPHAVKKVKMDGKLIEHEVVRATNVYMVAYVLIFVFSCLLVSLDGQSLVTNFTAVAATFNNIGPGLEMVGPSGNFQIFSNFAKLVLIFDMLAGRLEIFPILVLFSRETWRRF